MAPNFEYRPTVIIEQGGAAEVAFGAVDEMIDGIPATTVFSHCIPNPYRESGEE
jgi:hypothetical protein